MHGMCRRHHFDTSNLYTYYRRIDIAQHPHERTVTSLTHSRLVEHVGCWWEDALE